MLKLAVTLLITLFYIIMKYPMQHQATWLTAVPVLAAVDKKLCCGFLDKRARKGLNEKSPAT
jgi:hypothetical protein